MDKTKNHAKCNLIKHTIIVSSREDPVRCYYCTDHNVIVSKDLWEMGWYGGEDSKAFFRRKPETEVRGKLKGKKREIRTLYSIMNFTIEDLSKKYKCQEESIKIILKL